MYIEDCEGNVKESSEINSEKPSLKGFLQVTVKAFQTCFELDKTLEFTFSVLIVIGTIMVSLENHYGWLLWTVSSIVALVWSFRKRFIYVSIMNVILLITNIIGCYNYLNW